MGEEPALKRPRLEGEAADAAAAPPPPPQQQQQQGASGPRIASLFQVPAGLPRLPSPGAMHGCRVAACALPGGEAYAAALASGACVYWSQLGTAEHQLPEQGKEGVLIPVRMAAPPVAPLRTLAHRAELQALALHQDASAPQTLLLAAVDAYGHASISRLALCDEYVSSSSSSSGSSDGSGAAAAAAAVAAAAAPPEVRVQAQLAPLEGDCEAGWAGIAFSSSSSSGSSSSSAGLLAAVARSGAKDVAVFDASTGQCVRSYASVQHPGALLFLPPDVACGGGTGGLLALAEGHLVSLWDARASGSCVARLAVGSPGGPLYCLAWCGAQGGLLGAAGAERSLFLTEPRKWRPLAKWAGAARQAVTSVSFLHADPRYAVLAGLDMEVLCGRWDAPRSNERPFQSVPPGDDGGGAMAAAPGAPGSGDRTRGAGVVAGGGDGGGGAGSSSSGGGGFSFRGDARWLGVSRAAGCDVLAGFAASGNLAYARVCAG